YWSVGMSIRWSGTGLWDMVCQATDRLNIGDLGTERSDREFRNVVGEPLTRLLSAFHDEPHTEQSVLTEGLLMTVDQSTPVEPRERKKVGDLDQGVLVSGLVVALA